MQGVRRFPGRRRRIGTAREIESALAIQPLPRLHRVFTGINPRQQTVEIDAWLQFSRADALRRFVQSQFIKVTHSL